jgi:hypothetical protein
MERTGLDGQGHAQAIHGRAQGEGVSEREAVARHERLVTIETIRGICLQVLRPTCWTGLPQENRTSGRLLTDRCVFAKTPLWRAPLHLGTDGDVRPATYY